MVGGEEAIKKTGRDNHHFLLATSVEDEVTKIAICSVLPIFDRKANFYGNSHFRVKYYSVLILMYIYVQSSVVELANVTLCERCLNSALFTLLQFGGIPQFRERTIRFNAGQYKYTHIHDEIHVQN